MKGFIVTATYRMIDNKPHVFLFGRLENGDGFIAVKKYKPYFYIKRSDLTKAKLIEKFDDEKSECTTFSGEAVAKIVTEVPSDVPNVRKAFEDSGIECYEADIRFVQRFLIDRGIKGSMEIEGDYDIQGPLRVYKEPELKPAFWEPKLKIVSIDIETDSNAAEIYCISLATGTEHFTFFNGKEVQGTIFCKNEEELLLKFREKMLDIDPDVITGWNVIDFDFKTINERFKANHHAFMISRDNSNVKLKITEDFLKESTAEVGGRVVIDGLQLLKKSFVRLSNYKLETAAREFLEEGKLISFQDKRKEIERLYAENPKKLADYNLEDAELVLKILKKTSSLDIAIRKSLLTGLTIDRTRASIASLDSLYLAEAKKRNLVCPTAKFSRKEESIKGGFVMESKPGIYDYILVLDFKSLYPSIIRTFNIDPASYVESCKGKNLIKAPNGACFKNEEGILPSILQYLWEAREDAKKRKDEAERYAIKILMNSFFGVLASPNCRFFSLNVANAITHFGQHIIKLTAEKIAEEGYEIIYGDTDSLFVKSNAKSNDEAEKIGKKLQEFINSFYGRHIKKEYKRTSFLELQYEKCFTKFLIPKLRNVETGAKKRYAGLIVKDGKEEVKITGMEFVRGDWTDLARRFQYALLNRLFHDKEIAHYINDFVKQLKEGKLDDELVYRKSIRKGISDYAVLPPHVKAAKQLDKVESSIIEYVITTDGPEPVQKIRHNLDYEHYIKKQVKPIAESILCFLGQEFDDVIKGNRQSNLANF